jgi:hypothetical protein
LSWGRKDRGNLERTANSKFDAGDEDSNCADSQNEVESSGEEECIAENVEIMLSSNGIMWKVEKKRAILEKTDEASYFEK